MNAFYRLFVKLRVLLLFLILETVAFLLLANHSYYQHATVVNAVRTAKGRVDARIESWNSYFSLRETNEQLAQENNELRNRLGRYESVDTLIGKTIYDSLETPLYTYLPAVVVTNAVSDLHNYITLNVGADKGVEPLMGVMVHNGLVGTVVSVSEHYSLVMSLLNTDFRASAKLARSGAFGSLYWPGKSYRDVLLTEIPQHIDVNVGDTVVSSGKSDMFPPDVPIGVVKSYSVKRGNFYEITVMLFADFKTLRYVEIVEQLHRAELRKIEKTGNHEQ